MVNDPEVSRFLPPGPDATMETFQEALELGCAMKGWSTITGWKA
jgi:hypothetical protein